MALDEYSLLDYVYENLPDDQVAQLNGVVDGRRPELYIEILGERYRVNVTHAPKEKIHSAYEPYEPEEHEGYDN